MLELARGIAFCMNIGDLLELLCPLESEWIRSPSPHEEEATTRLKRFGRLLHFAPKMART
jgi:hypothetical protein